jgi:hypothetical protein
MIINDWDSNFTAKYNHQFPDSYLCIDTEYTGNDKRTDLIVEIGHTMVQQGKVVDSKSLILNWYGYPGITDTWLNYRLNLIRANVGSGWRLTPEVIRKEGIDPLRALKFYEELFTAWQKNNLPFVAQNGQNADERIISGNFDRFLNKPFSLPDNGYFDTGAIYKADKVWQTLHGDLANFRSVMMPVRGDTLKTYFNRVINTRINGVKWKLDLIMEEYDLINKHKINKNDFHGAGFDSMCLHWIMEEFRKLVKPKKSPEMTASNIFQAMYDEEMSKYKMQETAAKTKNGNNASNVGVGNSATRPSAPPKRRQRLI